MQHRLRPGLFLVAVTLGVAAAAPAHAQRMPDMATLDRGDGISRFGLDFGAAVVDDAAGEESASLRFDFFGQFVSRMGWGVYGSLPVARSMSDGESASAIGNVDLGLLYVVESPVLSLVFRGGIALPTADDDAAGFVTNYFASWTRLTDIAQAIPNVTYARFGFSPLFHANHLFLRADLGADVAISKGDEVTGLEPDTLLRLNIGGGLDLGSVAIMAELVNLATTEDFDEISAEEEDFVHTFAVSARYMHPMLQPYFAVGMPVDTFGLDAVDFFIGAGLQVAL